MKLAQKKQLLLLVKAFLAVVNFVCVSNLSPTCKNSVPPTLFPFLVSHYLNGLFLHIFLNVLNCVHVRPPPVITYLIIHIS
jgi:hypothetical protein